MIRTLVNPIAISIAILAALPLTAGTISVRLSNARGAALVDAVVYAIPQDRAAAPPRANAIMDQKDRTFIPHVLPIQRGTAVEFPNSDDVQHHVYSFSPPKTFQLPLYKGRPAKPVVFDKEGVVALGCNIHDRMSAFIVVVDTPHFGKSDASGIVVLADLPPGRYAVRVWYPEIRREPAPVRVTIRGAETHTMTFSAASNALREGGNGGS